MSAPQLSLSQFLNAAGAEQAVTAVKLWEDPEIQYLVLFADSNGDNLAVLPVGIRTDYRDLNNALDAEIEGLRAQAWTYSLATLWAVWTQGMVNRVDMDEKVAKARAEGKAEGRVEGKAEAKSEVEDRLVQATRKEQQVEERLADLERLAESIEERQKFIEDAETRLAARAQELTEVEARLEQTRSDMDDRRRASGDKSGKGEKLAGAHR